MNLFKTPKAPTIKLPETPTPQRLPALSDSSVRDAALKQRQLLAKRRGYLSTILSDNLSGGSL